MKVLLFSTSYVEYMIELANAISKIAKVMLMIPENYLSSLQHGLVNKSVRLETSLDRPEVFRENFKTKRNNSLKKLYRHTDGKSSKRCIREILLLIRGRHGVH